ncbi:MAG: hypothetical protein ABI212_02410 [Burkholderiaceae bacterium]
MTTNVSRQQCVDRPQFIPSTPSGAGAAVGALVGAGVDNALSRGGSRVAAIGLGPVAAALIGNQPKTDAIPPVATP